MKRIILPTQIMRFTDDAKLIECGHLILKHNGETDVVHFDFCGRTVLEVRRDEKEEEDQETYARCFDKTS